MKMVILYFNTARHNVKSELVTVIKEWDDLGGALGLPCHVAPNTSNFLELRCPLLYGRTLGARLGVN